MSKITYEEALHSLEMTRQHAVYGQAMEKEYNSSFIRNINKVEQFIEQHRPPTFDEVVKAWEDTIDDRLEFKNNDEGIRIIYPNGIYYLINCEQVYSNRKVFSMNVNATLNAINLTVEYLKNRQIIESDKATK